MNIKNAQLIHSEIGEVIEIEDPELVDVVLRGYLCVKVSLNSRKPLPTGFWLPLNDYTSRKVEYIYEDLYDFCHHCGTLGHTFDVCKNFRVHNPNEDQPENI